jgi:5-carboxymethyl-2-hydroxymuconate isomerase
MPHVIVEYSSNLETQIDIPGLVRNVHEAALATGVFERAAVRTRAERRDCYVVADSHPDNCFVAVVVRIAPGRNDEIRHRLGSSMFDALCDYLGLIEKTNPIVISLEVQEVDPAATFRKNNLPSFLKARAAGTRA